MAPRLARMQERPWLADGAGPAAVWHPSPHHPRTAGFQNGAPLSVERRSVPPRARDRSAVARNGRPQFVRPLPCHARLADASVRRRNRAHVADLQPLERPARVAESIPREASPSHRIHRIPTPSLQRAMRALLQSPARAQPEPSSSPNSALSNYARSRNMTGSAWCLRRPRHGSIYGQETRSFCIPVPGIQPQAKLCRLPTALAPLATQGKATNGRLISALPVGLTLGCRQASWLGTPR